MPRNFGFNNINTSISDDEEKRVLETAMECGHILLENGAEISRVEETMDRVACHYNVPFSQFFVLSNGLMVTSNNFAKVMNMPVNVNNLDKVVKVNELSRRIEKENLSLDEVRKKLDNIRTMPGKSFLSQVIAAGIGGGCFSYMLAGNITDSICAFICAILMYSFVLFITPYTRSKITRTVFGGAIVTFFSILLYSFGFGDTLQGMIIGGIIPLIPGVPFTNGIRDFAKGDYLSGAVRLLDAILVFLCMAVGVGVIFSGYHWIFGENILLSNESHIRLGFFVLLANTLAAAVGTAAFSLMFGVNRKYYFSAAMIGGLGWLIYLLFLNLTGVEEAGATFFATIFVMLTSRIIAVIKGCPTTIFLISGIIPLVPGAGIFWTSYYLVTDQLVRAKISGLTSLKTAFAIVFGIVLISEIPQRFFSALKKE